MAIAFDAPVGWDSPLYTFDGVSLNPTPTGPGLNVYMPARIMDVMVPTTPMRSTSSEIPVGAPIDIQVVPPPFRRYPD